MGRIGIKQRTGGAARGVRAAGVAAWCGMMTLGAAMGRALFETLRKDAFAALLAAAQTGEPAAVPSLLLSVRSVLPMALYGMTMLLCGCSRWLLPLWAAAVAAAGMVTGAAAAVGLCLWEAGHWQVVLGTMGLQAVILLPQMLLIALWPPERAWGTRLLPRQEADGADVTRFLIRLTVACVSSSLMQTASYAWWVRALFR